MAELGGRFIFEGGSEISGGSRGLIDQIWRWTLFGEQDKALHAPF
jgi:hypothetical protein